MSLSPSIRYTMENDSNEQFQVFIVKRQTSNFEPENLIQFSLHIERFIHSISHIKIIWKLWNLCSYVIVKFYDSWGTHCRIQLLIIKKKHSIPTHHFTTYQHTHLFALMLLSLRCFFFRIEIRNSQFVSSFNFMIYFSCFSFFVIIILVVSSPHFILDRSKFRMEMEIEIVALRASKHCCISE